VLCGDFNLLPGSASHDLLRRGSIAFPRQLRRVERFLFDHDIAKAARPLRLLGLDAATETREERAVRTERENGVKDTAPLPVFERAMREGRVLVSASKRLLTKHNCPVCYYIDARQCEAALAKLCTDLSVELRSERFYSQCVKCNGRVASLGTAGSSDYAVSRGLAFHAPEGVELFECTACKQIYWFSPNIDSASARAQRQVKRLVSLVEQCAGSSRREPDGPEGRPERASASFLHDGGGRLAHGRCLTSAYADLEAWPAPLDGQDGPRAAATLGSAVATGPAGGTDGVHRRQGIVTNSKCGFHGCIDYLWLTPELLAGCQRRLRVPSEAELRGERPEAKPLPSLVGPEWPSDHWPLAVDIEVPSLAAPAQRS